MSKLNIKTILTYEGTEIYTPKQKEGEETREVTLYVFSDSDGHKYKQKFKEPLCIEIGLKCACDCTYWQNYDKDGNWTGNKFVINSAVPYGNN